MKREPDRILIPYKFDLDGIKTKESVRRLPSVHQIPLNVGQIQQKSIGRRPSVWLNSLTKDSIEIIEILLDFDDYPIGVRSI